MKYEFIRKKLDNGLVILFEKRKLPVVSISASVRQGFAYEPGKVKGISHFTEHMLFKGTKARSYKEITEQIEKRGGILNAYTDEEVTSYWNKLPNKHFSTGIDIASDLVLNPALSKLEFEKEKRVILEEIKMYRDNPQLHVLAKIKSLLYKKPFGINGAGTHKTVSKLTPQDIANFVDSEYKTNKMFLCVVGNTSLEDIEKFGKRFPKSVGKPRQAKVIKINKQEIEKRRDIDQANFVLGFHTAGLRDKQRYSYQDEDCIHAFTELFHNVSFHPAIAGLYKTYFT